MALKTFLIDELHSVNKNINLIKNNMNNGQILDEVKHLRDDNNSKNTIIKLLTENISDITKSFSNKPNQEKPFISPKKHAKNINKIAATDKNIVPLANRFRNLMFDYTDDLEIDTNKKNETHQNNISVMNTETTRLKRKSFTRPSVVTNQHPGNQHDFLRKRVTPGERLYKDALNETKSKENRKQSNKIIIFGGSIPRGIKVNQFNYYLKSGETKFKCIPGASAPEMKFYVEPTLETNDFNVVLLHVDINYILKNRSSPDIEKQMLDIKMIIDKCKSFGV